MRLTDPLTLRGRAAPNRLMFGPHETNLGLGRAISHRHLAYYERRAAGGAGTIVVEEASVHPSDWPYERAPLATECAEGWSDLAEIGRRHGTVMLAAIGHSGGQGSSAFNQAALWAPSGVPEVNTREVPKVMEQGDIDEVVAGFGDATRLAVAAGLDGVEVNAGQHSLVRQFLSGLTNMRGDDYGADKARFAREVLETVRSAAGERIVGLRFSADELAPWAGITPEAAGEVLAGLVGFVDYVVVVRGAIFSVAATRPDGHDPAGFNLDLAKTMRDGLNGAVPVFAQGSIVDVDMAAAALADGKCDAVEMTRAQIAEPDLGRKLVEAPETIRPCVLCNQMCKVRDNRNPLVTCIGEPRSGHETVDPDCEGWAREPLDLTVVGGGVAGLEAARVAAGRGHRVRLVERSDRCGGVLRTAATGAGRSRLAALADWLEAECRRLDVRIDTGTEATADEVAAAEHVIVATGGRASEPGYDVAADVTVRTVAEVLDAIAGTGGSDAVGGDAAGEPDGGLPAGPVLVWDPIGGPWAISAAEVLAHAGREVTLVTPDLIVGTMLSLSGDLAPANVRLQQLGVTLVKRAKLRAVRSTEVDVEDRFRGETRTIKAACVVDGSHRLPDHDVWDAAGGHGTRIGDCVAPRSVHEAVLEARRAVLALEEA
ncbi:MAG: mycofactocin system FadH/OYE family oxidoreductase 1 [Actinomycetota bacterium]|nr:mycofactocin system FadH/OYE family oxidoreductase 1 [Actinomycetota bacterium]